MSDWILLKQTQHAKAGWRPYRGYTFAAKDAVAPLVVAELAQAALHYPLGFVLQPNKQFQLVAVQGTTPGENLFVNDDGHWACDYIPSHYRGYPFSLAPSPKQPPPSASQGATVQSGQRLALAINQGSGLFHNPAEHGDTPLFEKGGFSPALERVVNFLRQRRQNHQVTQALVKQLADSGIFVPWKKGPQVGGLHRVDEKALRNLTGEDLQPLVKSGAMTLAYIQMFSEHRLPALLSRKHGQNKKAAERDSLESLFETDDDFDFDFDS